MTAVLQVSRKNESAMTGDQLLHEMLISTARELGFSKKQSQEAAEAGSMKVDGVKITVTCLETDAQKDAIIVAKLAVPTEGDAIRQLLEINLIAAIAMRSTIAIDCDGEAILLALVPIASATPTSFAHHIGQMALFANTLECQLAKHA
ncbi:MAG: CesT family type III secretion system chaperone [Pseudomonadota bacterium]